MPQGSHRGDHDLWRNVTEKAIGRQEQTLGNDAADVRCSLTADKGMMQFPAMRVLIADDTVLMRTMLSEQVASYGHDVILAKDGREALERAQAEPFDIAIIDWEMPWLSGLEVCWHLKADPRTAYSYLILMTSHDEPFYEMEALDAGADDFIHKPVNRAHLKARLKAGGRITEMHRLLVAQAQTDPLTGVANRRALLERAGEEIRRALRSRQPLSSASTTAAATPPATRPCSVSSRRWTAPCAPAT